MFVINHFVFVANEPCLPDEGIPPFRDVFLREGYEALSKSEQARTSASPFIFDMRFKISDPRTEDFLDGPTNNWGVCSVQCLTILKIPFWDRFQVNAGAPSVQDKPELVRSTATDICDVSFTDTIVAGTNFFSFPPGSVDFQVGGCRSKSDFVLEDNHPCWSGKDFSNSAWFVQMDEFAIFE